MVGQGQSARLSGSGDYFECEDIFLDEDLTDKPFQVSSEAPAMNGFVPLTVVVGVLLFCPVMRGTVLYVSQTPDLGLILDAVEDCVDKKPERSGLLYRCVGLEQTW